MAQGARVFDDLLAHAQARQALLGGAPDGTQIYENLHYPIRSIRSSIRRSRSTRRIAAQGTLRYCATYNNGVRTTARPTSRRSRASRMPDRARCNAGRVHGGQRWVRRAAVPPTPRPATRRRAPVTARRRVSDHGGRHHREQKFRHHRQLHGATTDASTSRTRRCGRLDPRRAARSRCSPSACGGGGGGSGTSGVPSTDRPRPRVRAVRRHVRGDPEGVRTRGCAGRLPRQRALRARSISNPGLRVRKTCRGSRRRAARTRIQPGEPSEASCSRSCRPRQGNSFTVAGSPIPKAASAAVREQTRGDPAVDQAGLRNRIGR